MAALKGCATEPGRRAPATTMRARIHSAALQGCPYPSGRELHGHRIRQQARGRCLAYQTDDGSAPAVAIIERQVVHVHAHESIGPDPVETATKLHRVRDGFVTMRQAVGNAVV